MDVFIQKWNSNTNKSNYIFKVVISKIKNNNIAKPEKNFQFIKLSSPKMIMTNKRKAGLYCTIYFVQ